jgi:rod shape-determining protein MreD
MGAVPDTAVIIVVSYAILRGEIEGCILGFFAGLLYDAFFGRYFGFSALTGALCGYFCGMPFRDFFRENYILPVLLVAIASFVTGMAFYAVHFLLLAQTDAGGYIKGIILPGTAYTAVMTVPVYWLIYLVNKKLEARESGRG